MGASLALAAVGVPATGNWRLPGDRAWQGESKPHRGWSGQGVKLAVPSSSWQGVPAFALPEAGGAAQHPQHGASLPRIPVRALRSHLTSREAAGGGPHLPEPGYDGPGKERG